MSIQLPISGHWNCSGNLIDDNAPFAYIKIDFSSKTGTVGYRQITTPLQGIKAIPPNKFTALYNFRGHQGLIDATYENDQTISISLFGTVRTTCIARPVKLVGGARPISQWTTHEKVIAAINRSLPLLPADVRDQVAAMLTPQAVALMGGVLAAWGISHYFGVGFVADIILFITGGILLGAAALEGAEKIVQFIGRVTSAGNEADLDAAATLFAEAVAILGITAVFTVLMCRALPRGMRGPRPSRPAGAREIPADLNAVPPSKIPPRSRAPVGAQSLKAGAQPKLEGVKPGVVQEVLARLNQLRKYSIECHRRGKIKNDIDCTAGSEQIRDLAGRGVSKVIEDSAKPPELAGGLHSMVQVGEEVMCTRPGFWRSLFDQSPGVERALAKRDPSWPERLRNGIVMRAEEFRRFVSGASGKSAPESPMFDLKPINPGGG